MELKEYLKIIKAHLGLFLIVVILCVAAAIFWTKFSPVTYTASTTFTVNKISSLKQSNADYYVFDNYYNIQSAGLFSQIVATWFESPSLVTEIYQKAGIEVPNVTQKKLSRVFKAVREEPATINVTIVGNDAQKAEMLIVAASEVIQKNTNELGKNNEFFYEIAKFPPVVTENTPNIPLNIFIGFLGGVFAGATLAFVVEYFKRG